jgi:Rho termination factor, N-terminal domain
VSIGVPRSELEAKTLDELRVHARALGVKGVSSLAKPQLIDRLLQLDPVVLRSRLHLPVELSTDCLGSEAYQACLMAFAVSCEFTIGRDADAVRSCEKLITMVRSQPDDFRLVWSWTHLRDFVGKSQTLPARREALIKLLDSFGREKPAVLAGLQEFQSSIRSPAKNGRR